MMRSGPTKFHRDLHHHETLQDIDIVDSVARRSADGAAAPNLLHKLHGMRAMPKQLDLRFTFGGRPYTVELRQVRVKSENYKHLHVMDPADPSSWRFDHEMGARPGRRLGRTLNSRATTPPLSSDHA